MVGWGFRCLAGFIHSCARGIVTLLGGGLFLAARPSFGAAATRRRPKPGLRSGRVGSAAGLEPGPEDAPTSPMELPLMGSSIAVDPGQRIGSAAGRSALAGRSNGAPRLLVPSSRVPWTAQHLPKNKDCTTLMRGRPIAKRLCGEGNFLLRGRPAGDRVTGCQRAFVEPAKIAGPRQCLRHPSKCASVQRAGARRERTLARTTAAIPCRCSPRR